MRRYLFGRPVYPAHVGRNPGPCSPLEVRCLSLALLFLVLGAGVPASGSAWVKVCADGTLLTTAPGDADAPAVAVPNGSLLRVEGGLDRAYIGVEPPADVGFWVYADLVQGGLISAPQAPLRGGAGPGQSTVSRLPRGTRVEVIKSTGDWLLVHPPESCRFWVDRRKVERAAPPDGRERRLALLDRLLGESGGEVWPQESETLGVRQNNAGRIAAPARKPPMPVEGRDGARPVPEVQGGDVNYVGIIRSTGLLDRHADYRLIGRDRDGRTTTLCYLVADEKGLAPFVGRQVRITGSQYSVSGVRFPVVTPDIVEGLLSGE